MYVHPRVGLRLIASMSAHSIDTSVAPAKVCGSPSSLTMNVQRKEIGAQERAADDQPGPEILFIGMKRSLDYQEQDETRRH